ncbi:MAG: anti-phage dCTP deaminase [Thermoleophilia bacterium]
MLRLKDTEVVIGLIGAIGSDLETIAGYVEDVLKDATYKPLTIKVSRDVISLLIEPNKGLATEFDVMSSKMDRGDEARRSTGKNDILAEGVALFIDSVREEALGEGNRADLPRQAYIIDSLKHKAEIIRLREIYGNGFYLIGVHCSEAQRKDRLNVKGLTDDQAAKLMMRDMDEKLPYGQRVAKAFHMSDFFVQKDYVQDIDDKALKNNIRRILNIIFSDHFETPIFDEYAMYLAFSAALRSADLSRQVGAVIANNEEILAIGANDCPKFGGGLYWREFNDGEYEDVPQGRDYMRGSDSNIDSQIEIIEKVLQQLQENEIKVDEPKVREVLMRKGSPIRDITEYGRVVHAEMEAILSCARNNISTRNATLYTTTFPCHNCAKHIIAAGIKEVVYIEPYEKSKAPAFHKDSMKLGDAGDAIEGKVLFKPFIGVGPRIFFDLFSLRLGSGKEIDRKNSDGKVIEWQLGKEAMKFSMLPLSYLERENEASKAFGDSLKKIKGGKND